MRAEFRLNQTADFEPAKVKNTLLFLQNASQARSLEHRILQTLLHVSWYQMSSKHATSRKFRKEEQQIQDQSLLHLTATIEMLNESMCMCLPSKLSRRRDPLQDL